MSIVIQEMKLVHLTDKGADDGGLWQPLKRTAERRLKFTLIAYTDPFINSVVPLI